MSHLRTRMPVHPEMFKQAMEQRDAALAEVSRLREALEQVESLCDLGRRPGAANDRLIKVASIARAALATAKGDR